MRILVSGGGTAGHISPILATVDALKQRAKDVEILYVGQEGSMEAKIASAAGLEFASIPAGKFRRYHGTKLLNKITDLSTIGLNLRDSFRFLAGLVRSRRIIKDFQPDVVFVKGGYVGMPVGLMAGWMHIPLVVHESDIVPGLTNRTLAKRATKVATGFPVDKYKDLPQDKLVYTGSPIRREVIGRHRLEGLAKFKLATDLPVVLVMGGSSGARTINQAVILALPDLTQKYQVLHVAGEKEIESVRFSVGRLKLKHSERYQVFSFLSTELGEALAAADVVVSRAGANAIAELAANAKPTILVPGAHLSGGHQLINAQTLARAGAVRVIGEDRLTPQALVAEINKILESPEEIESLSRHIKELAMPDAAKRLADVIMTVGEETNS